MTDLPTSVQIFIAMGGSSLISAGLAWLTGHRMASANTRKVNAEAARLENENRFEASRIEASRVDFERTLNERTSRVMEALENQVNHLSNLVETQTRQIGEQSALIQKMESEIRDLHKALDEKTKHLHKVLAILQATQPLYAGKDIPGDGFEMAALPAT